MSAEIELSEAANGISDAIRILKGLPDTDDHICAAALGVLEDAEPYLEDVIAALARGDITEVAP